MIEITKNDIKGIKITDFGALSGWYFRNESGIFMHEIYSAYIIEFSENGLSGDLKTFNSGSYQTTHIFLLSEAFNIATMTTFEIVSGGGSVPIESVFPYSLYEKAFYRKIKFIVSDAYDTRINGNYIFDETSTDDIIAFINSTGSRVVYYSNYYDLEVMNNYLVLLDGSWYYKISKTTESSFTKLDTQEFIVAVPGSTIVVEYRQINFVVNQGKINRFSKYYLRKQKDVR